MEISKGFVFLLFKPASLTNIQQQSILVTNGTPPRACLSDFSCVTVALDSEKPIPFDVQLGHSTVQFRSPERFNPQKFGAAYPLVTREADIYAFGMTIFQVLP